VSRKCFVRTPGAGGVVPFPGDQALARRRRRRHAQDCRTGRPVTGGVDTHADVHVAAVAERILTVRAASWRAHRLPPPPLDGPQARPVP